VVQSHGRKPAPEEYPSSGYPNCLIGPSGRVVALIKLAVGKTAYIVSF
jgi:hypothetical protein